MNEVNNILNCNSFCKLVNHFLLVAMNFMLLYYYLNIIMSLYIMRVVMNVPFIALFGLFCGLFSPFLTLFNTETYLLFLSGSFFPEKLSGLSFKGGGGGARGNSIFC